MSLANEIKQFCMEQDTNQRRIAKAAGVHPQYINDLIHGRSNPFLRREELDSLERRLFQATNGILTPEKLVQRRKHKQGKEKRRTRNA